MLWNIVLVGVWWSWISSIAYLFFNIGYKNIIWIDAYENQITDTLSKKWIKIYIWHGIYQVQKYDLVIYSDIESIKNGPEVSQAIEFSKNFVAKNYQKPLSYNEFLVELSKMFRTIAISGNKGKTTTTTMTIHTFANLIPDFGIWIVGAMVPSWDNQNIQISQKNKSQIKKLIDFRVNGKWTMDRSLMKKFYFVIEACEYKDHFLWLDVDCGIITNIARDHPDYFKTEKQYFDSFLNFIQKSKLWTFCLNSTFEDLKKVYKNKSDYLKNLIVVQDLKFEFDNLIWNYQNDNASLVYGFIKNSFDIITKNIIQSTPSIWRRMEKIWKNKNWATIISDYGHNTLSLKSGICAIQEKYPNKELLLIFQPHQARRILQSWNEFVNIIKPVQKSIIYKIYTARENIADFDFSVFSEKIENFDDFGKLLAKSSDSYYFDDFNNLCYEINKYNSNFIILIMTAGDLDFDIKNYFKF